MVSPARLAEVWGGTPPGLVFLSACRTAESPEGTAESFARTLARAVPAVLGWDGSVYDPDAIAFAEAFYRELAGQGTPASRRPAARRAVLERHQRDPQTGLHWHLARLWLGAGGGGPLCAKGKPKRKLPKDAGYEAFLDKAGSRVPVAGALTFVGRRREAQAVLAAFRADKAPGCCCSAWATSASRAWRRGSPTGCRSSRRWWSTSTTTRWRCWSRSAARCRPSTGRPR